MIRVLIVDDSRTTRVILKTILETDPEITVVGEAENGEEALREVQKLHPDLITMDIHMPIMNGLETVKKIMSFLPTPILVVTGAEEEGDSSISFQALRCGALDVIDKPQRAKGEKYQDLKEELIHKVKILSKSKVFHNMGSSRMKSLVDLPYQIVAMGASTGGPRILLKILGGLPFDYPIGIFLVQHIAKNFVQSFTRWLESETSLKVKLAQGGEVPEPGTIVLAPSDYHMVIRHGKVALESGLPVCGCIPSIDVFFESVAQEYGDKSIGILLSGMGQDGAHGLKAIRDQGGYTIAQEEASCVIFGMPKVAIEIGAAMKICSPPQIVRELLLATAVDDSDSSREKGPAKIQ